MSTLIKNCKVLQTKNPHSNYTLVWKDVLIEGDLVSGVKDRGGMNPDQYCKTIDGRGRHVLLPAFVDGHLHSRQIQKTRDFRWDDPDSLPETEQACRELLMAAYSEAAHSGTAILMDYPEYPFDSDPAKDMFRLPIECMRDIGLTGVVRLLLSHDKPFQSGYANTQYIDALVRKDTERIERALQEHEGFKFAVWIPEESKYGLEDALSNTNKPKYELRKIVAYLQKIYDTFNDNARVYFVMHCAETKERTDWIRQLGYKSGVDFLNREGLLRKRTVLVHCLYGIQQEDIDNVRRAGASVVVRPKQKEYDGVNKCPVDKFLDNDVMVGLGTDVPVERDGERRGFTVISEIQEAIRVYGINFGTALYIATEMGANVFGFDNTGRVEPGCVANLIMLDTGQRLERQYAAPILERHLTKDSITHTFLRGKILKE